VLQAISKQAKNDNEQIDNKFFIRESFYNKLKMNMARIDKLSLTNRAIY